MRPPKINDDPGDVSHSRLGRRGGILAVNGSFTGSAYSLRHIEPTRKKLRRVFLTVLAVVKFWRIFEHIKQYGTSSNLYNIAFRSRKAVKKSIFPIVKLPSGVKVK